MSNVHEDYALKRTIKIIPVYWKQDTDTWNRFTVIVKKGDEEVEIHLTCNDSSHYKVMQEYDKLINGGNIGKQKRIEGRLI